MKLQVQGREAYVYTGGKPFDAARPTVVLVHGALNDHGVWNLLARWCAHHGYSVLAPDLPGHMRSEGPALGTIEAMADWTLALLDAAGVCNATLAGHSMGSLVALEAAARAPERAERLLMLGSCVPMPVPQALLDLSRQDPLAAIERVVTFSYSTLAAKPSFPGPGVWLRGAGRALMRQVLAHQRDPMLFHTDFQACNAYLAGLDAARRVQCPATLILAEQDQMTPPRAAKAVAATLGAEVRTVAGGHQLMAEQPEGVLAAVKAALAGTPATPATPA